MLGREGEARSWVLPVAEAQLARERLSLYWRAAALTAKSPRYPVLHLLFLPKQGRKNRRRKETSKKRLESLLAYHQRLVTDKWMPPSRLMLQHAANAPALPVSTPKKKEDFSCNHCEYSTPSKLGLVGHIGIKHKGPQKPEVPCDEVAQSPAIFRCTFCRNQYDCKVRFRDNTQFDFVMEKHIKCPLCDCYPKNCHFHKEHMKEKHHRDHLFTVKEYI